MKNSGIRISCLYCARNNAEYLMEILKTGGTLRFWGEWFGRPYDNFHKPVNSEFSENMLIIRFENGEKCTVYDPSEIVTSRMIFTSRTLQKSCGNGIITARRILPKTFADANTKTAHRALMRKITLWNYADH